MSRIQNVWLVGLIVIFLVACQKSTPTTLPTEVLTSSPSMLPSTLTPTVTEPPAPTMTPSPMPPTMTSLPGWLIPPLEFPVGVNDVLIYSIGRGKAEVFATFLDEVGQAQSDTQRWYGTNLFFDQLVASPDGYLLAEWNSNTAGDFASLFDPEDGLKISTEIFEGHVSVYRFLGWAGDSSGVLHYGAVIPQGERWGNITPELIVDGIVLTRETGSRLLVENPADYEWAEAAALSPSGRYLIYSFDYSYTDVPPGTWLLDLETGTTQVLFDFAIDKPSWSPDGQWVAFVAAGYHFNPEDQKNVYLILMRSDVSDLQIISDKGEGLVAWSPDGEMLAFVAEGTALSPVDEVVVFSSNAYLADIGTAGYANVRPIVPGSEHGYLDPAWSPEGDFLLVVGGSEETSQIWLVSRDGSTIRQLTSGNGQKRHPIWLRGASQ